MSFSEQRVVVITGIAGRLGRLLCRHLHRQAGLHVVGVDKRPFRDKPKDVEHLQVDLRSKSLRDVFRQRHVAAVIHLGVLHDPRATEEVLHSTNIRGMAKLLDACRMHRVPKLVVLSSANVYGPRPDNAQFLTEDSPLLGIRDFPAMRDLIEIDHLAASFLWKAPDTETVLLRPVHVLGTVRNAPSNYLRLRFPPTLLGFDPMIQVIHEEDVVSAILRALTPGTRGIFNVTGPGELPLSAILTALGRRSIPIPHPLARSLLRSLWRARATTFPVPELDFIRYVCMVDGRRATTELGFRHRYELLETLRAVNAA